MKKGNGYVFGFIILIVLSLLFSSGVPAAETRQPGDGQQKQVPVSGIEISTKELKEILDKGKATLVDVRPEKEYMITHIPGAIHIFETEIERMMEVCKDKTEGIVLYCNGPYCHKTSRVSERLSLKGCANIKKYQDGLPVWRAFGNTAETALPGFKYVYSADKTAVFVDARTREEYKAGSVPGAVNLQAGEIEAANQDGRLPYRDHGTRVIIFGKTIGQARQLAEAIAQRAYWNSSYLGATYEDLQKAKEW